MSTFNIPKLSPWWRLADLAMLPIMFMLRGFRFDSLQETHPWHNYSIDPDAIDQTMAVNIVGSDSATYRRRYSFLFHAPIVGGWKRYSVYEVNATHVPFRIGWVMYDAVSGKLRDATVQRLLIKDTRIRTLDGPPSYRGYFFAVDQTGAQVPLRVVGHGRLGDGKYLSVRLL